MVPLKLWGVESKLVVDTGASVVEVVFCYGVSHQSA